jgi:hypothetical protein
MNHLEQNATPQPVTRAAPTPCPGLKGAAPDRPFFEHLPPGRHGEWDDFVASSHQGSAFQATWWYRAWGFEPVVQVLQGADQKIEAGICYAVGWRFGTRAIVRPLCTAGNGPVFRPGGGQGRYKELTHAKQMTLLAIQSLPKLGFYDLRLRPADRDLMPYLWNGFETYVGYTYVIPVAEKDHWAEGAAKSTRKELRRAAREVVEQAYRIEENPEARDMLPLIQDTVAAKQARFPQLETKFSAWWQAIRAHGAGCGFLLRDKNGAPMAADILVWDQHTAYSVLGGIRADLRNDSRVGTILLERMVREAHGRGLDFDFEGSVVPGVERFMRSFGGELRSMCRVVKIRSPLTFCVWQAHRYFTQHRRPWRWVD